MEQGAGRSSERLVEELTAWRPGQASFLLTPIEAATDLSNSGVHSLVAYELPESSSNYQLNAIYPDTFCHIQLNLSAIPGRVTDWHLASNENENERLVSASFLDTVNNTQLSIQIMEPLITRSYSELLDIEAIEKRAALNDVTDVPSRKLCIETLARVITDILSNAVEPRRIPLQNKVAAVRLGSDLLTQLVGFTIEDEWLIPPEPSSRLRRLLVEVQILLHQLNPFQHAENFQKAFSDFFGGINVNTRLSSQPYGILGASAVQSDEDLIDRYEFQSRNDSINSAQYLDALKELAQTRQSEELEMEVMKYVSLGVPDASSLREAYRFLGLEVGDNPTDAAVLEIASDMLAMDPDCGKQLAHHLSLIAENRNSSSLRRAATATSGLSSEEALALLGLNAAASDDSIISGSKQSYSLGPLGVLEARAELAVLGASRRSPAILCAFEEMFPSRIPSTEEAYSALGVSNSMSDTDIAAVVDMGINEDVSQLLKLRRYLRSIAQARRSDALTRYLETGEAEKPATGGNVGLWNIGSTCYLNSLLQLYYTVKPVRDYAVAVADGLVPQQENDGSLSRKKVGSRFVPYSEVKRSEKFVCALGELYKEMRSTTASYVTPSLILAYMALVPPQEDTDDIVAEPEESSTSDGVVDLVNSPAPELSNEKLQIALQRQQDVTECIENVLFQLEASCPLTRTDSEGEQEDLVKDLFYGRMMQTLEKLADGNKRTKVERFSSLLIDVPGGGADIYDAMDKHFADEVLSLEGGDTVRSVTIKELPPILQIQIQRVQFDRQTFMPYKTTEPLPFPETIYLDRYMETDDPNLLEKRKQAKIWRQELEEVKSKLAEIDSPSNASLPFVAAWMKDPDVPEDVKPSNETLRVITEVYQELVAQREKFTLRQEELQAALARQFTEFSQLGYRVHAIFIHRGQAGFGHYWIYIRDLVTGTFSKFNDELVTQVTKEEVMDFSPQNLATPYYLVFIREDLLAGMQESEKV